MRVRFERLGVREMSAISTDSLARVLGIAGPAAREFWYDFDPETGRGAAFLGERRLAGFRVEVRS